MYSRWLYGFGIAATGLISLYFIIRLDFSNAVVAMLALFALTNSARAKQFRGQGMIREARWIQGLSILFTVAFAVALFLRII